MALGLAEAERIDHEVSQLKRKWTEAETELEIQQVVRELERLINQFCITVAESLAEISECRGVAPDRVLADLEQTFRRRGTLLPYRPPWPELQGTSLWGNVSASLRASMRESVLGMANRMVVVCPAGFPRASRPVPRTRTRRRRARARSPGRRTSAGDGDPEPPLGRHRGQDLRRSCEEVV
jgi:hypothetical protein